MAWFDWNRDGKKNWKDDLIEDDIRRNSKKWRESTNYSTSRNGDLSSLRLIISIVVGFFIEMAIFTSLEIDVENIPALVILILWFVFTIVVAFVLGLIGL